MTKRVYSTTQRQDNKRKKEEGKIVIQINGGFSVLIKCRAYMTYQEMLNKYYYRLAHIR